MKTSLIILLIFLVFLLAALQLWNIWSKIKFEFGISGIDILNIDVSNFLTGGNIMVPIRAKITNDNSFDIPFKKLRAWLYYDNTLIAKTSEKLASESFNAPAGGHVDLVDPVNIYLNNSSLNLIKSLGNNPEIKYTVKLTIFWIPFSHTDTFIAGKQQEKTI